jgi:hypothetical protein
VFASSSSLLIRTHNRARYQAEIPLIAPTEIPEPPLLCIRITARHTRFGRDAPASFTPSAPAFCRVAPYVRLSLRAITLVFVFSRTMVFNVRTSSLVHGRDFFVFFAITRSFLSVSQKAAR